MAVGTRNEQRLKLRRAVGHYQDTALVTDDMLDDALDDALLEINRHFSTIELGSFTTVADQQTYTGILPVGGYSIAKVFYGSDGEGACEVVPPEFETIAWGEMTEDGTRLRAQPSDALFFFRNRSYFRRFFESSAVVQKPDTVRLLPIPGSAVSVYFTYWEPVYADVADVEEVHERQYWAWAKYTMHTMLSVGRGSVEKVQSVTGMTLSTRASKAHERGADREHQRFVDMMPALVPARNWMV